MNKAHHLSAVPISKRPRWSAGPWTAEDIDDKREHPTIMSPKHCIAHVWHNDEARYAVVANAYLIAAAPDMYRAGEPLAALVESFTGADDAPISVTAGELRALAAALAKARGE